jgi:hypothetical protein
MSMSGVIIPCVKWSLEDKVGNLQERDGKGYEGWYENRDGTLMTEPYRLRASLAYYSRL